NGDSTGWLMAPCPGFSTKVPDYTWAVPELVCLDLPHLVAEAGYPGTKVIPAISLHPVTAGLEAGGNALVRHVYDLAADPASDLFTGLGAIPATSLTDYRTDYPFQHRSSHGTGGNEMASYKLA